MSRIKGRYVAKLIVDIDIERTDVMPSLDIIKKNFRAFPNYLIGSLKDETDLSCCETYGPRWNSSDEEGIKAWNERKTQICTPDTVNLIETYLDGYKKGMHDTEELLKPFVKEGVLND